MSKFNTLQEVIDHAEYLRQEMIDVLSGVIGNGTIPSVVEGFTAEEAAALNSALSFHSDYYDLKLALRARVKHDEAVAAANAERADVITRLLSAGFTQEQAEKMAGKAIAGTTKGGTRKSNGEGNTSPLRNARSNGWKAVATGESIASVIASRYSGFSEEERKYLADFWQAKLSGTPLPKYPGE